MATLPSLLTDSNRETHGKKRKSTSDSSGQKVASLSNDSIHGGEAHVKPDMHNAHGDTGELRSPDSECVKSKNGNSLEYSAIGVIRHKLLFSTRPRLVLACKLTPLIWSTQVTFSRCKCCDLAVDLFSVLYLDRCARVSPRTLWIYIRPFSCSSALYCQYFSIGLSFPLFCSSPLQLLTARAKSQ